MVAMLQERRQAPGAVAEGGRGLTDSPLGPGKSGGGGKGGGRAGGARGTLCGGGGGAGAGGPQSSPTAMASEPTAA